MYLEDGTGSENSKLMYLEGGTGSENSKLMYLEDGTGSENSKLMYLEGGTGSENSKTNSDYNELAIQSSSSPWNSMQRESTGHSGQKIDVCLITHANYF